ncbi:TIGR03564 family F420-dependent LLM class oxidoreductase [Aldersonia sp. NBC_00410]|uniref:TIGR03564 family F420-dependent LLM class oxidoreductase n=1 Tax=Aldersonia sp. NBC_00410 TaxID=2975954 RepID=UPI00225347E7|nr:TIGR03564 family F420-dependent LLM class oxidoreductase [Aldersonia sp. NBC_00410]MCX5045232.1 TIGR03564 family F420-dependent LLM class oxidoreductase [Aldersonia sp. NBC_00410]
MDIGVFVQEQTVDTAVERIREADERGFARAWMPQVFGIDALTVLAIAAREAPTIGLGTAVVPTYPRHPFALATQARTVAQVSDGRFTLGIGLSHKVVIEGMLGMKWGQVRHLRDYLSILMPLLAGEPADYAGETLTGRVALDIPAEPVPTVVAALGPKMLELAGRMTAGTATWMSGLETVGGHVVPSIRAAAEEAGRPAPQIVVALPVAVTDDPEQAREHAAKAFRMYGSLPSYRAMLDREGAAGPADVVIAGNEATVRGEVERFAEAGATEFVIVPFFERERTLDCFTAG